jgi:DNA mismatch repair protein MutL
MLTVLFAEDEGARILCDGGKIAESAYAGPSGTTVIVENLFYLTPARKKFLKSKAAESRALRETMLKIALCRPATAFVVVINGRL